MRRENYEFVISKPQVILKEINGTTNEPMEVAHIEVPQDYSGIVIEELSRRKGELRSLLTNEQGITTLEFAIPTRGLMGYRNEFLHCHSRHGNSHFSFRKLYSLERSDSRKTEGRIDLFWTWEVTGYVLFHCKNAASFSMALVMKYMRAWLWVKIAVRMISWLTLPVQSS